MKKKEILVVSVILFIAIFVYGFYFFSRQNADHVIVKDILNNKILLRQPLNVDGIYVVKGQYGKFKIEVKGGLVLAKDVECPNKVCEKMGPLGKGLLNAPSIICIPNGLEVILEVKDE